jgi:hypothetical protein
MGKHSARYWNDPGALDDHDKKRTKARRRKQRVAHQNGAGTMFSAQTTQQTRKE